MRYPTNAWRRILRDTTHLLGASAFAICTLVLLARPARADVVMYRVNSGGPQVPALDSGPVWTQDLNGANASPYVNAAATTDQIFTRSASTQAPNASVPSYVPLAVFDDERWDPDTAPEMQWEFPVPNGLYRVNLMLMEGYVGTQYTGARRMNVVCEGLTRLSDYDIYAHFGGYVPGMESFLTNVSDGSLSLIFEHIADDPAIRGIEIVAVSAAGYLEASPKNLEFGLRLVNTLSPPQDVTITNIGAPGDPALHIGNIDISSGFLHNLSPQTLAPGESRTFQVRYAPSATGPSTGTMTIAYDGANSPLTVNLHGTAASSFPVSFGKSQLAGGGRVNPTSLQFGPDGRLYVAERNGRIFALTVQRTAGNQYGVTATEQIDVVRAIPNHDDNGAVNTGITDRLVTGILVRGTASSPVIYVTSSDPRMDVARDLGGDTNSGILSRIDRVNGNWVRTDLVRGLPRSKDDHCTNGMALDPVTNTLYIGQAGNCNMGAPSLNFSFLPEYALTGAILSVDLNTIGNTTYDLPTLDDEDRAGVNDANDPFGGNYGKNQAVIVPGGPVKVHSSGYRNPYDVLIHSNGHMYTSDNGPNAGWGGPPLANGPGGVCTNSNNDNDSFTYADNLHMIPGPGYYAGHPNPTRASRTNTFNASNPQSPVPFDDPAECEYRVPGSDGSIAQWMFSVDGLVEYKASNFGNALKGSILAASFNNTIERIVLNPAGDSTRSVSALFNNIDITPLDVTAQGDGELFAGTVWTADYVTGRIWVFEPSDYDGGGFACTGTNSAALDEDGDGYSNADEIANGTNPCSAADQPADFDHDLLSDKSDPDDDNDGLLDVDDAFARDASNGANTTLPVLYTWDGGNPGTGLLGLGFTGLMTNGTTDYLTQYALANLTAGGAAGKLTIDAVPAGDALGSRNSQQYAFQFGVAGDSTTTPFRVHTRVSKPYFGSTPADSMSEGVFLGDGTQDDYVKLVIARIGGQTVLGVTNEVAGVPVETYYPAPGAAGANEIDLYLEVNPATGAVQPRWQLDGGAIVAVGTPILLPASSAARAAVRTSAPLAVGIISTSRGAAPFTATWDFLFVEPLASVGVPHAGLPQATRLLPCAPHPVRGGTTVRFELAGTARANVALYSVDGRLVRQIADGWRNAGTYALPWDGLDERGQRVAPGVYFVRLQTRETLETGRMIVLQ